MSQMPASIFLTMGFAGVVSLIISRWIILVHIYVCVCILGHRCIIIIMTRRALCQIYPLSKFTLFLCLTSVQGHAPTEETNVYTDYKLVASALIILFIPNNA